MNAELLRRAAKKLRDSLDWPATFTVALAVASWLDATADVVDVETERSLLDEVGDDMTVPCAFAVARAVLREEGADHG